MDEIDVDVLRVIFGVFRIENFRDDEVGKLLRKVVELDFHGFLTGLKAEPDNGFVLDRLALILVVEEGYELEDIFLGGIVFSGFTVERSYVGFVDYWLGLGEEVLDH